MESKTHIRTLQDNNFLGAWDLPLENDGKKVVTIIRIESQLVENNTGKKERKPILFFKEFSKGMVLGSRNRDIIQTQFKTSFVEDWIGRKIELHRVKNQKVFDKIMDVIKVSKQPVEEKKKEVLDKSHNRFDGAVLAIKQGKTTIKEIQKIFELSNEFLEEIKNENKAV